MKEPRPAAVPSGSWKADSLAAWHASGLQAQKLATASLLACPLARLPPANGCRSFRMLEHIRMLELLTPHTFSCSFIRVLNQNFHVEVKHGRVD